MRLALFILATLFTMNFASAQTSTITLKVEGIEKVKGKIGVGIYKNPSNWLGDKNQFFIGNYDVTTKEFSIEIPKDIEFGTYGITIYHDINGNGEFDYSFGIPTEPYGFTNNPRAKWSKPSFKRCAIEINQAKQTVVIPLQSW